MESVQRFCSNGRRTSALLFAVRRFGISVIHGGKIMKRLGKISILSALLALITASTVVDSSAQTRRRPALRKKAVVKRTVPSVKLYTVPSGERLQARMNN